MSVSFPVSFSKLPCVIYEGEFIAIEHVADMLNIQARHIYNVVPHNHVIKMGQDKNPHFRFITLDWLETFLARHWYDNQTKAKQAVQEIRQALAHQTAAAADYWPEFEKQLFGQVFNDDAVFDMMKTDEFKKAIQDRIDREADGHVIDEVEIRRERMAQIESDLRKQVNDTVKKEIAQKRYALQNTPITLGDVK